MPLSHTAMAERRQWTWPVASTTSLTTSWPEADGDKSSMLSKRQRPLLFKFTGGYQGQRVTLLCWVRHILYTNGLMMSYKMQVRPITQYSSLTWISSAQSNLSHLDKVQQRAECLIHGGSDPDLHKNNFCKGDVVFLVTLSMNKSQSILSVKKGNNWANRRRGDNFMNIVSRSWILRPWTTLHVFYQIWKY